MMKNLKIVFAVVAAVVLAVGCAKNSGIDTSEHENEALEAWMNKTYPDWQTSGKWMKTEDGNYILWLRKATVTDPKIDSLAEEGDWVRINYTGKRLNQDVFYTRSEAVAKVQGTYNRRTHYVPDFVHLHKDNSLLPKGTREALTYMRVGDMVRIIMPSGSYMSAAGYSSTNVGYNGQFGLPGNVPVIVDSLELLEITTKPIEEEEVAIGSYVQRWGMNPADSLEGFKGLYVQLQNPFPFKRDSVVKDSTLTCYYKAYFLDGFVFDSNIDSVQMRAWGEILNEGPMTWDMKSTETQMIEGFKQACCQACYGDHIRTIFTSAYGYGISGSAAKATTSGDSSSSDFDYSSYYNYLNYYSYMNGMYGGGYGGYGGYGYGGYYDNYYNSMYYASLYNQMYNSSSNTSSNEDEDEETKTVITTEILPFTPLIFEIWVCADNGTEEEPKHSYL
ncbi:MAG: FKBP-type peptidyl-prolyl cis-trans isomerase [Tidjanibacter sp.]|nr:FKBP-type peptidyl-prolyl cis-trans isomerase [Tidjanibacter sp.]